MAHRKTEKERQLGCGREGKRLGEEPNRTTARKLVLFKSINTLWKQTSREKTEMFRDRLHGTRRWRRIKNDRQTDRNRQAVDSAWDKKRQYWKTEPDKQKNGERWTASQTNRRDRLTAETDGDKAIAEADSDRQTAGC
jgi:hypothetical protein